MSVDCSVALVEWNEFKDFMASGELFRKVHDYFAQERLTDSCAHRQEEFLECLDRISDNWAPPGRDAFARIFRTLFCSFSEGSVEQYRLLELDLPREQLPPVLELAWRPETVRRFADLWLKVDLTECERAFVPGPDDQEPFADFEHFRQYAEEWAELLRIGAKYGFGLIKCIWV